VFPEGYTATAVQAKVRPRTNWRACLALYKDGSTYSQIARKYGRNYQTVGIGVAPAWDRFRPFYEWATQTGYRLGQRPVLVDGARESRKLSLELGPPGGARHSAAEARAERECGPGPRLRRSQDRR